MENKSNSLSRVERHQREKVLRFSIRKYSFGAASVAVAALMFLGARVASADSVIENNSQNTTDVVKQKDKDKSLAEIQQPTDNKVEAAQNPSEKEMATNIESVVKVVDKANLRKVVEELNATLSSKSNLDNSVISPIKDRVQKGQALLDSDTATQKDVNDLLSLLENDLTVLSNATKESSKVQETTTENKTEIRDNKTASELSEADKTISDKKESLKLSAEQLQAAVLELPEHESTKEVFEKANELLVLAQGVLQNTTVSLTDVEQMNKLVKRMFISVKNATTRLSSGSHDPRNGKRMRQGTGERAATVSQTWTSERNILSYQRFRVSDFNGNLQNGNRQLAENKVDMTARFETINGSKYVVYDVFFNNDGRVMGGSTHEVFYKLILQPEILDLNPNGTYKSDTLRDLKFEIYQKNGNSGTLSQNPGNFSKKQTVNFDFLKDSVTREGLTYKNTLDIRHTNDSYGLDMKDTFKSNRNDPFLAMAVSRNSVYGRWSYGFGVTTLNDRDAVHMQVKAKLKQGVTEEKVKEAYTLAVAGTQKPTTNQSYVFVSGKNASENYTNVPDRPVVPTVQQNEEYRIKGKEVTKTVGDSLGNVSNPVESGFVVRNDDSKKFPDGMSWNWTNGQQPNTNTAGIFKYDVTAHYYDNSSNSTTVTLKVKPKKPVIEQSSVNEKAGKTGQNVVVTVQDGVPEGSTVILYNGTNIIGRGRTSGRTATINVSGALPSTSITAKTIVGGVESDLSNPVKPTEVPDKQPPTVSINGNRLTANENDNRFIIYRGANFNPTFRVQDDKNNVTLSITNLPEGVKNVSTSGSKDLSYTIPDNYVADNASLGERTATVVASDGRNSATYKFKYRIVDVQAKNSTTENRILGSTLGDPHAHFKVAESNTVENDKYYPTGMQFKWKEFDSRNSRFTDVDNNTKLNDLGTITKYIATATFPRVVNTKRIDNVDYTIYSPTQKPVQMTFNVTDNVKPTVKLVQNNQDITLSESTPEARVPKVTVYRGEKAEITVKASDNTGKLSHFTTSGLPSGVTETGASSSDSATDAAPLAHTLSGKVATNTALGDKVLTVVASDKTTPTNTTTVKFKLDVKAQNEKYTPTAGTTVTVGNIGTISQPDEDKIKNAVTVPALSEEATRDGVTKRLKDNGRVTAKNGKNYVTVEVIYPDRSKDEVDVAVEEVLKAGEKNPTNPAVEGQPYTSKEKVINPNKDDATFTATPTNGLTVGTDGKVTGKPTGIEWTGDETSKTVNIPVTVTRTGDTPVTVTIPVVVQRDLDGDGKPDISDDDIDGDGIPNEKDTTPRQVTPLDAGKVNPTNPAVEGQPYTSNEKVINPNKDDATFTATPTNGLTVGTDGKVTGKPTGITWTGDETSKTVNIPVTVTRTGDTPVTVTIPVVVQRDLDGDGKPDVSDDDIDGDGIPNDQDPAPRVKDGLTAGKVNPTNPAVEGQPYTSKEKVINPNKDDATFTATPTNGLTVGTDGKVTGKPTGIEWTGDETSKTVNIPVTVTRTGDTPVTVTIPVVVQRDLDGDGTPDVSDDDIDGDGIPNDQDPAPRVKDGLTSGKVTPTNKAVDGQPYTSKEKVINPNKPGTTVTPTPTNGLTIDGTSGKVTGTPTGLTWNGDDTEQTVNIPVVITKGNETVNVTIPVVVQRDVTKTPTFTVGNQDPTDGHVDVTVSGVPDGTKVTLPGVNGEKVVTGGKVTLTNDELPETPQTGKGRAQEDGKLPKEGTSDITIPGKISSSKGEPEVQTETPDYTNTIPVTPVKPATNDNGAKSNDSQNVLPNTGTESNAALASLGLLGLLSGFGLVARKKKED